MNVLLVLGDWSDDGHGINDQKRYNIGGYGLFGE